MRKANTFPSALAAAAALVVPVALPDVAVAGESAEEATRSATITHCFTEALTEEEVAAGVTSTVVCHDSFDDGLQAMRAQASMILARHYDATAGGGAVLTVTGSTCSGSSVSFGGGSPWNDAIRSTRNAACGNSKHFANADQTGDAQLVTGSSLTNVNSTLAGRVSSVGYDT